MPTRAWRVALTVALLLTGWSGPAAAGESGRGDRLCFATSPPVAFLAYTFALDLIPGGDGTVELQGRVVFNDPPPAFTMVAQGSGRVRADGKLEFMLTVAALNPAFPIFQLWTGRLEPPAFELGFGFGSTIPAPPVQVVLVPAPCPTSFPDSL
jgi:hypothetical protein